MKQELKKVGDMFRGKREEMSLSLKEVENATSIRMMYLQAIEEGQVSQFLSPVYALGFIKQYATFLGMDGDKLLQENPEAFKMPMEKQEFSYGIGTLERRNSSPHGGGTRWMPNFLWGGVTLLIAVVAWYFAKFLGVV